MNRLFWLINIILLALAAVLTMDIARYAPAPDGATGAGGKNAARRAGSATAGQLDAARQKPLAADPVMAADTRTLWQQSLFRPDRTEEEPGETGDAAAAVAAGDLDLIGIGILGNVKAAIILTPAKQSPARSAGSGGVTPKNPADAAKREKTKHVYRVGQIIGDTGYQLREIRLSEVVISRGGTEQTLKIVFGGANSLKRQGEAAAESQRRLETNRAAMAVPPPVQAPDRPPLLSPAAPAIAPAGGGAPAMSDETKKRLEEIRTRREEILRRMREQNNQRP